MKLNTKQQLVMDRVANTSEKVLNVIGESGVGKSFLIHTIAKTYPDTIVTATTGIAAKNINGSTLHSYLKLSASFNDDTTNIDDAIVFEQFESDEYDRPTPKILIIDESSMMGESLFKMVMKESFDLLILFGDNQQLDPVKDNIVDFTQFETIELTEQMRTKSNAYKLIKDYRTAKENSTKINLLDYVDEESVEQITYSQLNNHYHSNPSENKRVISYTNDMAEEVVKEIKPTDLKYQLHSPIRVFDGFESYTLAPNGQEVEIEEVFTSWKEASFRYLSKNQEKCEHRTKWNDDYKFTTRKVSLKGIDTHFIRLLTDNKDIYDVQRKFIWQELNTERDRLKDKYGHTWAQTKSVMYETYAKQYMDLSNNIVRARHVCSLTAHKAQGQSIDCVYINVADMMNDKSLMYVALSRAINKIVLIYPDPFN